MKKLLFVLAYLILYATSFGQTSTLIVFSEKGESFYLSINGIQQNKNPESGLKVEALTASSYQVKIVFDNPHIPEISKTIYFNEASVEATYVINKNKKDQFALRFVNQAPINPTNSIDRVQVQQPENEQSSPEECQYPVDEIKFKKLKQLIASKTYVDTRLTTSKQIILSNCISSLQIREILMFFEFEDNRLELAKFAYTYVFDTENYSQINDAFHFEGSIEELNSYIEGKK